MEQQPRDPEVGAEGQPPKAHSDEVIAAAIRHNEQLISGERIVVPGFSVTRGINHVFLNFDGAVASIPVRPA